MAQPNRFEKIILQKIDYLTNLVEQGTGIPTQVNAAGMLAQGHADKPMTVAELSTYLSISDQSVYKRIKAGSFPYHRKGNTRILYFYKSEIDEYLKSN